MLDFIRLKTVSVPRHISWGFPGIVYLSRPKSRSKYFRQYFIVEHYSQNT
jgi:hypothetical protein